MRKILIALGLILTMFIPIRQDAREPGGGMTYCAIFDVEDTSGAGVGGVQVKLKVTTWYGNELDPEYYYDEVTGTTDASGYVQLEVYVPGEYVEGLDLMHAQMIDPDYSIISSENTTTQSWQTIWPEFVVVYDLDGDLVDDDLELQLAEKFKPILHKHSFDEQEGLANADLILQNHSILKAWDSASSSGNAVYNNDIPPIHTWENWYRCSFGTGQTSTIWRIDIDDSKRKSSAPIGQRPLYFHLYKSGEYYYLQYWYFLGFNDLSYSSQTPSETGSWHEGDWEHVSLQIEKISSTYVPTKVNFYKHKGGHTRLVTDCWWSPNPSNSYSNIQQGYDENHTHLNIWIAANSHASYNRYSPMYNIVVFSDISTQMEDFTDNCDYDPSGNDLYFEYDYLEKLGEVNFSNYVEVHGYDWFYHIDPIGPSKEWLGFVGRWGEFWSTMIYIFGAPTPFRVASESPLSPTSGSTHEWKSFSQNSTINGFGNDPSTSSIFGVINLLSVTFNWVQDPIAGD